MFYNMGNIEDDKSVNSIYDENIAAQYVDNINAYPLALDAAIACYSWGLLYDNHQLLRLFYPLYQDEISDSLFSKVVNNTYKANGNFYFEGQFFVSGNILKIETMTPELSLRAAEISQGGNPDYQPLILWALSEGTTSERERIAFLAQSVQSARQRGRWVDKLELFAAAGPILSQHPEYHDLGESCLLLVETGF